MTDMFHVGVRSSVARKARGNVAITMNRQHNLNSPIRPASNQVLLTLCYSRVDALLSLMKLSSFIPAMYTDFKYIRLVSGSPRRYTRQFPKRIPFHITRRTPRDITLPPHISKVSGLIGCWWWYFCGVPLAAGIHILLLRFASKMERERQMHIQSYRNYGTVEGRKGRKVERGKRR